ncbi:hypothetical protein [Flavihumibacter fluvii]|nr:hypothetical protein [Flavihumibacter fluvii]ULQ52514.1 hypothetical protein KJS93_20710 [Flavihumibacter fluvii]
MKEETISWRESFILIESMINSTKNQFSENGRLYFVLKRMVLFFSLL